jgi:phage terminase Nu1 subunit (DNA packaging protein)
MQVIEILELALRAIPPVAEAIATAAGQPARGREAAQVLSLAGRRAIALADGDLLRAEKLDLKLRERLRVAVNQAVAEEYDKAGD